jgi:hypothetical protein
MKKMNELKKFKNKPHFNKKKKKTTKNWEIICEGFKITLPHVTKITISGETAHSHFLTFRIYTTKPNLLYIK